jgi:hypothetical protein
MEKAPCNGALWAVLFPPPDGVLQQPRVER